MPIELISEWRVERRKETVYEFENIDVPGGWAFPCSPSGHVDTVMLSPTARRNYFNCLANVGDTVIDLGVQTRRWEVKFPAIGRCPCGGEVWLEGFTCPCSKCHLEYNSSGQLLAPRHLWGEETGEHWSDIARIP